MLISRYGKAEFVFAPNPTQEVEDHGKHYNYVRPLATIEPTAIALGRPVDTRFGFKDTGALAHDLMEKRHHNELVFVAWEHVKLVEAVRTLVAQGGGDPAIVPEWPDSDFDSLYPDLHPRRRPDLRRLLPSAGRAERPQHEPPVRQSRGPARRLRGAAHGLSGDHGPSVVQSRLIW